MSEEKSPFVQSYVIRSPNDYDPCQYKLETDQGVEDYHPDCSREMTRLSNINSDTEGGSDNSESSRPGVFDYYPAYDNKKSPKDTVERSYKNNTSAYDEFEDVDSMSSMDSPRDANAITDGANHNPPVLEHCVINMVPVDEPISFLNKSPSVHVQRGHMHDEEEVVVSSDDDDAPTTAATKVRIDNPHQYLYGANERLVNSYGTWSDHVNQIRTDHRMQGLSKIGSYPEDEAVEMKTFKSDRHTRPPAFKPYESNEEAMKGVSAHYCTPCSEDSKSSEESGKQEATKKRRKKRKTKSTSSLDIDNVDMDENGNPPPAAELPKVSQRAYNNQSFSEAIGHSFVGTASHQMSRPEVPEHERTEATKKKKNKRQPAPVVRAEDIPGHQGNKDLDEIMEYIEPNSSKKSNGPSNNTKKGKSNGGGAEKRERKVKSKTPEPRLDQETDSTSSETVSNSERSGVRGQSESGSRIKADSVDVTEEWSKDEFKLVGGKKKNKRSGKEKDEVVHRPIRSKTPPPRSRDSKLPVHSNSPPAGAKEERSLSPSAFPKLGGSADSPPAHSTGRRNSTGNAPSDHDEMPDFLSPDSVATFSKPISYAKIAASPKPKNLLPHQSSNERPEKDSASSSDVDSAKRNLDCALDTCTFDKDSDDKVDVPPRAASAEPTPEKRTEAPTLVEKAREWPSTKPRDHHKSTNNDRARSRTDTINSTLHAHKPNITAKPRDRDNTPPVQSRDEFPSLPCLPRQGDVNKASEPGALPTAGITSHLSFANAASQGSTHSKTCGAPIRAVTPPPVVESPLSPCDSALSASCRLDLDKSPPGAMSSKAVIFLDDENYSPQDLGIRFEFDSALSCEPPPELVAAVEQGEFNPRSESPCNVTFGEPQQQDEPPKDPIQPINGLVLPVRPVGDGEPAVKVKVKVKDDRKVGRYREDDSRCNLNDVFRFLQREWQRIQDHKEKGTMRVVVYNGE